MSLINDALKKAQRQRTGDSPQSQPPLPGSPVFSGRPTRTGNNSNPQLLLVGAGALLGVVIAGGAFFLLRSKPATESAPSAVTPAAAEVAALKIADRSPTADAPPAPATTTPAPEPVPVVKTPPAVTVQPPVSTTSAPPLVAEKATESPALAPAPTPTATGEPSTPSLRMIETIEAFRVAGIRVGTGTDAKVLMNDRVYRVGDTVDHALGIKLAGATASSLTFRDASGATYTRNF